MVVNRTRRRKKFLELVIWEAFTKFLPKEKQLDACLQTPRTGAALFSVSELSTVRKQFFLN